MMDKKASNSDANYEECQSGPEYSNVQVLVNNLPYIAMTVLGTAVFVACFADSAWGLVAAGVYLMYGIAGALWIMIFVCPFCQYWGTRSCPCGYGILAAKLRERKALYRFGEKFKKHIPVIVPLWFLPLIAGISVVIRGFSWPILVLLILFALDAFLILPLVSTKHGCKACPQKDTCPWMGIKGKTSGEPTEAVQS